ncbi:MAG: hypothetical protein ACKVXR_06510 [Planctomycetota bacterium]
MDLRALKPGVLLLACALSFPVRARGEERPRRFEQALAATDQEPDATSRARARVEILYSAGDLPGALREALAGLRLAPGDRILLRRALELETALRLPELARAHSQELERAVRRDVLDDEARLWWEREAAALSEAARKLQEHQARLGTAITRARWVCVVFLAGVLVASAALARSRPTPVHRA